MYLKSYWWTYKITFLLQETKRKGIKPLILWFAYFKNEYLITLLVSRTHSHTNTHILHSFAISHTQTNTHINSHTHTYLQTYAISHTHTQIHKQIHTHTNTEIHIRRDKTLINDKNFSHFNLFFQTIHHPKLSY